MVQNRVCRLSCLSLGCFMAISFACFSQAPPPADPLTQDVSRPEKPEWIRSYWAQFKYLPSGGSGPVLERIGAHWDYPSKKRTYSNPGIWVEFLPKAGPSIWAPSALMEEIPSFVFAIAGDIDGKGYRVWNADRTALMGEEHFEDLPKDLGITLEACQEDAMVVHVNHPHVIAITVRWSADGKEWTLGRTAGNHSRPQFQGSKYDPDPKDQRRSDLRIHSFILAENPHPWVEVEVFIGMTRITKRFIYGKDMHPTKESYEPRPLHVMGPDDIAGEGKKIEQREQSFREKNLMPSDVPKREQGKTSKKKMI